MKNTFLRLLVALTFGLALVVNPSYALQKQVTTVSAVSSTVFTPGWQCQWVTVSNIGAGGVYLSFDGTAATSSGYPLAAAEKIVVVYAGSSQRNPIKAILQSGTTTTLNIVTADTNSQ